MKKILLLSCLLAGFVTRSLGQAPQSFNYQAVARDAANQPYQNTNLGIHISLASDSLSGGWEYAERHEVTTTDLGVFTLKIGQGATLAGDFAGIDWSGHAYYLRVAIDPEGGTNYVAMGSSQLLSVPYALYANQAGGGDSDNDPANEIQTLVYDSVNQQLTISGGNTIKLSVPTDTPHAGADDQILSLSGAILSIENGNSVDLSALQGGTNDADVDTTNEIQQLQILNDTLFLSKNGGSILLPDIAFSLPFSSEAALPDTIAFGIANTTAGNGVAIAGKQGAGSSIGLANGAAVFGTTEQGFGVVGLSSGNGTFAGVLGRTNDSTGTGVIGIAEGKGRGGFFQSSGGAALITGAGNVGIGTHVPEAKLEVNGDLRVNANVGKFVLGYPNNGHQWTLATNNTGVHLFFGAKADTSTAFTSRMAIWQDGRVGIGITQPAALLEIAHNSTHTQPQLLLTEKEADYARLSFKNNVAPNVRWNIDGLTTPAPVKAKLNFRFQNNNVDTVRMTLLGNGKLGIGNTGPDQELVVGNNIGSGWAVPAITVGNEDGGALETGNAGYSVSLSANNSLGRARIITNSPNGPGLGKLEVRTDGLSIGHSPGEATGYMMKVVHEGFGINLHRNNSDFNWELYVAQGNGELRLYFDGSFRGAFNPTDGIYTASDRRFKTNIQPMKTVLASIMQLSPSSYQYLEGNPGQKASLGFVAQDVEKFFPELVSVSSDERSPGVYSLNYAGFGVLAIKAIQEQQEVINLLKTRIEQLEALLKK